MLIIILILNIIFWFAVFGWMYSVRMLLISIADQLQYTEANTQRRHRELMAAIRPTTPQTEPTQSQREVKGNDNKTPVKQAPKSPKIDWDSKF